MPLSKSIEEDLVAVQRNGKVVAAEAVSAEGLLQLKEVDVMRCFPIP